MAGLSEFRLSRAALLRMAADALMVNFALILALLVNFLFVALSGGQSAHQNKEDFQNLAMGYFSTAPLLTVISLTVFALSGFYSYGRSYQGRYKALVILQAVANSFLIFTLLIYLIWERFSFPTIPRSSLLFAFLFTTAMCLAARTWSFLWEKFVRPEKTPVARLVGSEGKHVLVIGGAGYIGSALLPKLLSAGYRVRVLDLFLYGKDPIRDVVNHPQLELLEGDFRNVQKVVEAMRDVDSVIHLGAIVGDPACDLDSNITMTVNLTATQMIAQVAKATGIRRFIFASTCSVYGASDEILDERSEVEPISLYGRTKLAAEKGLRKMVDENFNPTILRFGTIYGLSGRTRFDLVVNLLAAKAKVDGIITVHGGNQWRPFVHVDDASKAVFMALNAPLELAAGEIFNVGSEGQNKTITQIGEMIRDQVVGAKLVASDTITDRRNYRVRFSHIKNTLGFEPSWSLEQGIHQVVEAVANGTISNYNDPQYSNVKYLSQAGAIEVIRSSDADWGLDLIDSQAAKALVGGKS